MVPSGRRSHLAHAAILIPHAFDPIVTQQGLAIGSLTGASAELAQIVFSPGADTAIHDWREAIATATARRLPMIIDT